MYKIQLVQKFHTLHYLFHYGENFLLAEFSFAIIFPTSHTILWQLHFNINESIINEMVSLHLLNIWMFNLVKEVDDLERLRPFLWEQWWNIYTSNQFWNLLLLIEINEYFAIILFMIEHLYYVLIVLWIKWRTLISFAHVLSEWLLGYLVHRVGWYKLLLLRKLSWFFLGHKEWSRFWNELRIIWELLLHV